MQIWPRSVGRGRSGEETREMGDNLLLIGGVRLMLAAAITGIAAGRAAADSYPDRAVRIIVPTSPGGSIDGLARTVAARLAAKWAKPVVVENRSGAAMRVGADAVAKAAADGHTLLVAHDGAMA